MNRTTFLISYVLLAWLSGGIGNSWTVTVMFMRFATMGWAALGTPEVIISIAVPIGLIVIARMRGKSIGKPWLVWLPVAALFVAILPWMTYAFAKQGLSLKDVPIYLTAFLSTLGTLGPIVLHTVCATLGAQIPAIPEHTRPIAKYGKTH